MKNQICTVYVVRHGVTEWNKVGRVQGHTDIGLAEEGELQALELSEKLKDVPFAALISSDLSRAKHTAEIIARRYKKEVVTTPRLRERHWGHWEGEYFDELRKIHGRKFDDYIEHRGKAFVKHPELHHVETYAEAGERAIAVIRECAKEYLGKNLLIVTHGGVLKAIMLDMNVEGFPNPAVQNTGYLVIESDGEALHFKECHGIINKDYSQH